METRAMTCRIQMYCGCCRRKKLEITRDEVADVDPNPTYCKTTIQGLEVVMMRSAAIENHVTDFSVKVVVVAHYDKKGTAKLAGGSS